MRRKSHDLEYWITYSTDKVRTKEDLFQVLKLLDIAAIWRIEPDYPFSELDTICFVDAARCKVNVHSVRSCHVSRYLQMD